MTNQEFLVTDVFTPTKAAKITFVERKSLENKLIPSLSTPGKQIVIYGHSGSGKSTLLINKLQQANQGYITTRCMSSMKFDQLVLDAFDQLGIYYESEKTKDFGSKLSATLKADYAVIKAQITGELSENSQVKSQRILPPQLTSQALAKFLGGVKFWWVLEDFHKIEENEKAILTQVMKIFMDASNDYGDIKIVAIGAVDTARQIVELNPEMKNRVAEIKVPLMTHQELKGIIHKGEKALNFHIPSKVQTGIIHYSNGLASVCHQLCLNICFAANVKTTLSEPLVANEEQLAKAVEMYLENASDTLKNVFDKAIRRLKKRKYDNGRLILGALSKLPQDGATFAEILSSIKKIEENYPASNLTFYLNELQKESRGSVIRYDSSSGKYSFSDPIYLAYAKLVFKTNIFSNVVIDFDKMIKQLTEQIMSSVIKIKFS